VSRVCSGTFSEDYKVFAALKGPGLRARGAKNRPPCALAMRFAQILGDSAGKRVEPQPPASLNDPAAMGSTTKFLWA